MVSIIATLSALILRTKTLLALSALTALSLLALKSAMSSLKSINMCKLHDYERNCILSKRRGGYIVHLPISCVRDLPKRGDQIKAYRYLFDVVDQIHTYQYPQHENYPIMFTVIERKNE